MGAPTPVECLESPACCFPAAPFYGQGQTFLNAQTGFLLTCPPQFSCDSGSYPTIITVLKGEIAFTPPPNISPLRFTCCDGSIAVRYLPDGFTFAQFAAAAQSIADEAAAKLAQCIAEDYNRQHARQPVRCVINSTSPLPEGTIDEPYSVLLTQTGATLPVTWSLLSGTLPPGLSLSSGGVISGTPTGSAASYGFVVRLTNTAGTSCTKQFTLTITGCGDSTNFCTDPGDCRLRIASFNAADFPSSGGCTATLIAAWDGTFPTLGGFLVCQSYFGDFVFPGIGNSISLGWVNALSMWRIIITQFGVTIFIADRVDPSPVGVYNKNVFFSCTGPATVTLEPYSL